MPQNTDKNIGFYPFLEEGSYKVVYYRSKEVTVAQKQLLRKLSKLFKTNNRTQEYFRQIKEGGKPLYNSRIGISKREYDQLIELFSYREPEKFIGTLKIMKDGDRFTFQGQGGLSLLDSVAININSNSVSFKQYSMSLVKDSIDLSGEDIPKGDTVEFYQCYKGPDGILGLTALDGAYELLICKLKPGNGTYLSFFAEQPNSIEHPIPEFITVIVDK